MLTHGTMESALSELTGQGRAGQARRKPAKESEDFMKTEFKYIHFVQQPSSGKTSKWSCKNFRHEVELGIVKWHSAWKQYCFFPTIQAVYSVGCLNDIAEFISLLSIIRSSKLVKVK